MLGGRYETLTERINAEFFVDRRGRCVKYQPHYEYDEAGTVLWLDREDKPYYLTSLHAEIGRQVLGDELHGSYTLQNEGWVVVGECGYSFPFCKRKPTQSQIDTMFDLGYPICREEAWMNSDNTTISVWEFHER